GIVVRTSDRLIGGTGFHHIDFRNRHVGFGITIGEKEEWGKGYGTEATRLMVQHAFETLNLNRVWLHVYEYNQRGIRAYERAGLPAPDKSPPPTSSGCAAPAGRCRVVPRAAQNPLPAAHRSSARLSSGCSGPGLVRSSGDGPAVADRQPWAQKGGAGGQIRA